MPLVGVAVHSACTGGDDSQLVVWDTDEPVSRVLPRVGRREGSWLVVLLTLSPPLPLGPILPGWTSGDDFPRPQGADYPRPPRRECSVDRVDGHYMQAYAASSQGTESNACSYGSAPGGADGFRSDFSACACVTSRQPKTQKLLCRSGHVLGGDLVYGHGPGRGMVAVAACEYGVVRVFNGTRKKPEHHLKQHIGGTR